MAGKNLNEEESAARLAEAKRALAGPEWTAKHESEERQRQMVAEQTALNQQLTALAKAKEKLELTWIDLDGERRKIRAVLNPILDEEKKAEEVENQLAAEEAKIGVPAEKHTVEEKRWAAAAAREAVEKKKWIEEAKVVALEKTIAENTVEYRRLLTEEEAVNQKLEQLTKNLNQSQNDGVKLAA